MKTIPLEKISSNSLPNVAHQLVDLSKATGFETPESFKLGEEPFRYIDELAHQCADGMVDTKAVVLYDSGLADIGGMVIARFVEAKWSGLAEKPPKRQKQLKEIGSGVIADQVGLSPEEMITALKQDVLEKEAGIEQLDCIVPQRIISPRSGLLRIIGLGGMEEYPAVTIGNTKPFISHSEVSNRRQVYCGEYVSVILA